MGAWQLHNRTVCWIWCLLVPAPGVWAQALPSLSLTPSAASFSHQIGSAQLPAPQTLQVKRSGTGPALDFTVTVTPAAPWLIVTPTSGKTGSSISVRVNPTSLVAGTYTATLQVEATGASGPATAQVVFIVRNPPPTMGVSPGSLAFNWQTDSPTAPGAQTVAVTTTGEPLSFTASVSGAPWLSISPAVGVVLAGSPVVVTATVDTTGLLPATYTGKVTFTSTTAANKSVTLTVTLTIHPGTAVISSIWPSAAPIGSNDATITLRGNHFFKASVVKANSTDLAATWVSREVLLAVVPKALMNTQGTLAITVTNSPRPASNSVNFTVTPPGPTIQTVVNAASFALPSGSTPGIAPGEIISIFGAGLGPSTALVASPTGGSFPTSLGTPPASVEFELTPGVWTPAPILLAQANQINCQAPFAMTPGTGLKLRVVYNSLASAPFLFDAVPANPGLFTVDSSGRGQAAALNYAASPPTYTLNSASNPVAKGGVLILYLTGGGAISPAPSPEGQLISSSPLPSLVNPPSVTLGGEAASVISATAVPGAIGGLVQLNVNVPSTVVSGKEVPVRVTVAGRSSPSTATVAVK
ncbi:MAG: hypothetical protein NZV14_19040 [Bryobacteraceae bacterium]|nr:hypothetical protein [Bryobacteraceae bacterium]MDW8380262.1 hypothetical protein [Bryobacterales bacterium]